MSSIDVTYQNFDSISAYARWLAPQKDTKGAKDNSSLTTPISHTWCKNTDLTTALEIARAGGYWPEGAKELQRVDIDRAAHELADSISPAVINDVQGGAVDVGAYLADDEECFYRTDDQPTIAPVVRIGANIGAIYNATSEQLFNRGRAIMAVVEALELQGYSVELDALTVFNGEKFKRTLVINTVIKHAGEGWDSSSVAFALAHPAYLRRLGFKTLEMNSEHNFITREAYGCGRLERPKKYDLYIPRLNNGNDTATPAKAMEYVKRHLADQCDFHLK